MSRRTTLAVVVMIGFGAWRTAEALAQDEPTHPIGDANEINLIYWYNTKNPDKNFQVRVFDDRPIPDDQKIPGSLRGYNKQHYAAQMAMYEDKYQGWKGATTELTLRPGFGTPEQLAQQAKDQVDEEVRRLKNVIKTRLGKMDTPRIPYQDVKPIQRGGSMTKGTTGFTYNETPVKKSTSLSGTTWRGSKPNQQTITFNADGTLTSNSNLKDRETWRQDGNKVYTKFHGYTTVDGQYHPDPQPEEVSTIDGDTLRGGYDGWKRDERAERQKADENYNHFKF